MRTEGDMAARGLSTPQVGVDATAIVVAAVFLWVGIGQRTLGLSGSQKVANHAEPRRGPEPHSSRPKLSPEWDSRCQAVADRRRMSILLWTQFGRVLLVHSALSPVLLGALPLCLTGIFGRLLVECPLAASRAEVIRLPLVIGLASGLLGIYVHAAHGIFYHRMLLST